MTTANASLPNQRRSRTRGTSQNVKPVALRVALLLAIALSLPLLYSGGRLLLADIAAWQAQAFLDDWNTKSEEPSPRAWQVAHDAAQRAVELYPGRDGEYLQRLGHVHQWKQFRQPFGAPETLESRRAALEAFRAASEVRPTWPYNWVALAYAKLHLLEFDDEFANALRQAQAFGPHRVEINRTLAEIGFIAWPSLSSEQRAATLESARHTIRHGGKAAQSLLAVAQSTGMSNTLCQQLDTDTRPKLAICK